MKDYVGYKNMANFRYTVKENIFTCTKFLHKWQQTYKRGQFYRDSLLTRRTANFAGGCCNFWHDLPG